MKNIIKILFLTFILSCSKNNFEETEDLNAIIEENQYWNFYSKNGYLDSAVSKNKNYKVVFFYSGNLIDSIVELSIHAKKLANKDTFVYLPKKHRKYYYINNLLVREKIDISLYDYNLDTTYYLKSNDLKYVQNYDNSITITDVLNNYKTFIYLKNNNIIKTINALGTKIFEYDNRKNPYINFIGFNRIYSHCNFSEIAEISSQNNVTKMIWENEIFEYKIEYNSKKNPTKISGGNRGYVESFRFK
jgi:hypothetical protein